MTAFGVVPPEPHRQNALDLCAPAFEAAVMAVLHAMQDQGLDPYVYETLRSPERQTWLAGFGKEYDDGRGVITHAPDVLTTWHGYGLAADIISDEHQWNAPASFWAALGAAAAANGLTWGGAWQMKDLPHVQFGTLRAAPSDRARELYASGGLTAVWREVGAL